MTPLDEAHAAMTAEPDDDAARLQFYDRLGDAELFLMLVAEPEGETLAPEVFDTGDGRLVVAFDTERRLADFCGTHAFAALTGRALARMLAGRGVGLALNPEVAESATVLPAAALDWLAETAAPLPGVQGLRPVSVSRPAGLPEAVLRALDAKLARAAGMAEAAWLAAVTYESGAQGHLLAFVGAPAAAEPALVRAVGDALAFSGIEAGTLDVAFLAADDALGARLARTGLRFDLPSAAAPAAAAINIGLDPDRPPRLR